MKALGRSFFMISLTAAAIGVLAPAAFASDDIDEDWFLFDELNDNTFVETADDAFGTVSEVEADVAPDEAAIAFLTDSVDVDKDFYTATVEEEPAGYSFEMGDRDSVYLDEIISKSGIPEELGSVMKVNVEDEAMSDMIRVDWENDECIITPTQNFRQVTLIVVLDHDTCEVDLGNAYCTAEDTGVAAAAKAGNEKRPTSSLSANIGQIVNSIDPDLLASSMNTIRDNNA